MRWAGLVERAASWALLTLDLCQGPGKPCNTQEPGDDSSAHLNFRTAAQEKGWDQGSAEKPCSNSHLSDELVDILG